MVLALTTISQRIFIPYPILIVLGGLVLGSLPGVPAVTFHPDLVFLVFLPPILWAAAYFTSLREFRRDLRPISLLAVGLVAATTAGVAVVAHSLLPGMGWPEAIVLGAIVSPPDAVSATAIAKRLRIPGRVVTILEGESLIFGLRAEADQALGQPLRIGDVLEWPAMSIDIMQDLSRRLARDTGAALIIDYGYWGPAFGDTLQALKAHVYVDPLIEPGEADLTTHVDFHHLAKAASAQGLHAHGLGMQGDFLLSLGIDARASSLKKRATPAQSAEIDAALARLTERGETGMGELFKVLAVTHNSLEAVPGLHPLPSS